MKALYPTAAVFALAALLSVFGTTGARSAETDQALSSTLRQVYFKWVKAMRESDTDLWRKTTARYRQYGIRNLVVSEKKKWPDALFDTMLAPPDVSEMTLARVMQKGVTAQLIYYGKANFGVEIEGGEIPDGLLFLMFVKEKDGWKFNTSRFMSLAEAEEESAQAAAGDFAFLDAPDLQPPGTVPPLPKLCPYPELVGYVEIVSIGYRSSLKVNGHSNHTVIDNVQRGLIIGGLKEGVNPIDVEVRALPTNPGVTDAKRHFEFSVYRKTASPDEPLKRIYSSGAIKKPGRFKVIVRGGG